MRRNPIVKATAVSAIAAVCLLVASLWTTFQRPAQAAPLGQVQYKVVRFYTPAGQSSSALEKKLNEYGRSGWRLVSNSPRIDMPDSRIFELLIFMK